MKALKTLIIACSAIFCLNAAAQQFIYPNEGQSPEQQQKDEGECYVWAKGQTGFDPANPPRVAAAPPPEQKRGGRLRGAAVGAVVGEIVDDEAGKGAAAGAVIAGSRQRRQNREAEEQYQDSVADSQAQIDQLHATYNRAYSACMEGRGYTIK